jgi:hypothetical protein
MEDPRVSLATEDLSRMIRQYGCLSSVRSILRLNIRRRKAEMEETRGDPVHGPVAVKELAMARLRYSAFKKSLTSV